jgi:hypothetical protein
LKEGGPGIEGKIVIDELSQKRDAGRHRGIIGIGETRVENGVNRICQLILGVKNPTLLSELARLFPHLVSWRGESRKARKQSHKRISRSGGFLWSGECDGLGGLTKPRVEQES